jgi:hypothetical protein
MTRSHAAPALLCQLDSQVNTPTCPLPHTQWSCCQGRGWHWQRFAESSLERAESWNRPRTHEPLDRLRPCIAYHRSSHQCIVLYGVDRCASLLSLYGIINTDQYFRAAMVHLEQDIDGRRVFPAYIKLNIHLDSSSEHDILGQGRVYYVAPNFVLCLPQQL